VPRRAEQRALGGDAHRIGRDGEIGDAELLQMANPAGGIGEVPVRMSREACAPVTSTM
jgi:hypothetical protein